MKEQSLPYSLHIICPWQKPRRGTGPIHCPSPVQPASWYTFPSQSSGHFRTASTVRARPDSSFWHWPTGLCTRRTGAPSHLEPLYTSSVTDGAPSAQPVHLP